MIHIKPPQLEDTGRLLPLLEQLGYATDLNSLKERLKLYKHVLIAEINQKPVGLVAAVIVPMFIKNANRCHIEALIVDQHYRGQGIGKALLQEMEEIARLQECSVIDLTTGIRRAAEGTHVFYDHMGYKNEGLFAKLYLRKELV